MSILEKLRRLADTASPIEHLIGRVRYHFDRTARPPKPQWGRIVMYEELFRLVRAIGPERLNALELSPGDVWQTFGFKTYTSVQYPAFDICTSTLGEQFDVIIADQVFEHLLWPYRAGKNVYTMLRSGGFFVLTTPFLLRVHDVPVDCSRWTELGMKYFLGECGFDLGKVRTGSWGNRDCVRANLKLRGWASMNRWRSLRNEPQFPISIWAIAEK
jgi:SAM-dependent methyltransferase